MKMPVVAFLLGLALLSVAYGQNEPGKVKLYYSWYRLKDAKEFQNNLFTYEFSDSLVTVVHKSLYVPGSVPLQTDLTVFRAEDIDMILLRKKGAPGIAAAIGAATGAAIGIISAFASGGSYLWVGDSDIYVSNGTKALFRGFFGAGIGVGVGVIIGAQAKPRIVIKGDMVRYKYLLPDIQKYSISHYTK
jgi:hypothetical protein